MVYAASCRNILALILLAPLWTAAAHAQLAPSAQRSTASANVQLHKVVIQVDDNDPKLMSLALNNAENVREHYKAQGQEVAIEIVTFGPGLHMLRADSSPVKDRIAQMSLAAPEIKFFACANTQARMSKAEGKSVGLIAEATVVPSGVVRIIELQEKGFSYVRP